MTQCPLCDRREFWDSAEKCPGCGGEGKVSHFKAAELFSKYPDLARCDTVREMRAVRPEEPGE